MREQSARHLDYHINLIRRDLSEQSQRALQNQMHHFRTEITQQLTAVVQNQVRNVVQLCTANSQIPDNISGPQNVNYVQSSAEPLNGIQQLTRAYSAESIPFEANTRRERRSIPSHTNSAPHNQSVPHVRPNFPQNNSPSQDFGGGGEEETGLA